MQALRYLALTIGVLAIVGFGAYAPMILGNGTVSSSSTTWTTCTTTGGSTTTTVSTTSVTSTSQGSFTYSPSTPVKVESVTASTYQGNQGTLVTFYVTYQNVGSADIYTIQGCGSSLVASLPPGSTVLQKVSGGPVCLCAEAPTAVPPGGNRTSTTPGCWSAYRFVLVHPGTAVVDLTLFWGPTQSQQQDMTNITATFTFG